VNSLPFDLELSESLMRRAIELALTAQFRTDPNPIVGAVLVDSSGRIIAEGFHQKAGAPHAEVVALEDFESVPEDATLFVSLEPCNHHGKTPPCTELILKKKLKNVVVGCLDPNSLVSGRGVAMLRENGVSVSTGICEVECRDINRVFNKHIVTGMPYVTVKAATSLDGKTAMASGESQWITGDLSRVRGHMLRSQHQAIAIGRQTLMDDNPSLTDRHSAHPYQPVRVVYASGGNIPFKSNFVSDKQTRRVLIAGSGISGNMEKKLVAEGVEVMISHDPRPSVIWSLVQLYKAGICSMLIEGGSELIGSAIRDKAVDQLCLFISGKIIGNWQAKAWSGDIGIEKLSQVPHLSLDQVEKIGDDLMLTCYFPNV
jgi:diaminohydroxyphosphoribosylaminopyrimidine deaminase / 5-amino-6-(5-phosphoribosylamino)uracil reductase